MRLAIVHLSDIHLSTEDKDFLARAQDISRAAGADTTKIDCAVVVVSGDIAKSGKRSEYEMVLDFFTELSSGLQKSMGVGEVQFVVVPGNHDCDFDSDNYTRHTIGDSILGEGEVDGSVVEKLTAIQNAYFDFASLVMPEAIRSGMDKVCCLRDITVGSKIVRFMCYNTAWMARRDQQIGKTVMPDINPSGVQTAHLVCAVMHHDCHWFRPKDAQLIQNKLEGSCSMVFTGHEHTQDQYYKQKLYGSSTVYVQGGVLHTFDDTSAFDVQIVDLEAGMCNSSQFTWKNGMYRRSGEWITKPLQMNKGSTEVFENTPTIHEFLDRVGVPFLHPRQGTLGLRDIYVPPILNAYKKGTKASATERISVTSDEFIEWVSNGENILIYGGSLSGKTSFLKRLYSDLRYNSRVPLFISGSEVKSHEDTKLLKLIKEKYGEQYLRPEYERYSQLPKERKVLLVDDIDQCPLNSAGKRLVIKAVRRFFGSIVLTTSGLVELEELLEEDNREGEGTSVFELTHCELPEFGYLMRQCLIERWISLGQEYTLSRFELSDQVKTMATDLNSFMRGKLLPSTPFVVLSLLQCLDTSTSVGIVSGSLGNVYEAIMTSAMLKTCAPQDVRLRFAYLAEVAYFMFEEGLRQLDSTAVAETQSRYLDKHDIRIPSHVVDSLVEARVLLKLNDCYLFAQPYIFYYFVAYYFATYLNHPSLGEGIRSRIKTMTMNLYREAYANIMIFLCHFSTDPFVIQTLIGSAGMQFWEITPCDLGKNCLRSLQAHIIALSLPSGSQSKKRDEFLQSKDESEARSKPVEDVLMVPEDVKDYESLNYIAKVVLAIRTVEVLGEILRQYATTRDAAEKFSLLRECYELALRNLATILDLLDRNLERIRENMTKAIMSRGEGDVSRHQKPDITEAAREADQLILLNAESIALTMVKLVSCSVGSRDLAITYRKAFGDSSNTALRLIDAAIRLDHFKTIDEEGLLNLADDIRDNYFAYNLLRFLVFENLVLYECKRVIRERLATKLNLVGDPRLLGSPQRKTKQGE